MNKLSTSKRAQILGMLVEGMSMRAITRITGVSINTVSKLLADAGNACAAYHDEHVRGIRGHRRIECDEIWSFVYAKERAVRSAKAAPAGAGDTWTFTAIDADSKLITAYLVSGERDGESALAFMDDLRARLEDRPQLTTDGLSAYLGAVEGAFRRRRGLCPGHQVLREGAGRGTTSAGTARPHASTWRSGASRATRTCARRTPATSSGTTSQCGWGCAGSPG